MNFRKQAEMLVLFPKRVLAVFTDNTMPPRNWKQFDEPAVKRRASRATNFFNGIRRKQA